MLRIIFTFIILGYSFSICRADDDAKTLVKNKVRQIGQALKDGNYDVIVDLTYPKLVEMMGSRQKMIESVKELFEQMKSKGASFESFEVGDPSDFYSEGKNTFVLVPITIIMKFPKLRAKGMSYELGISSDDKKTWNFIESKTFYDKKMWNQLKIKLPPDLKIPEQQKPEIIKD